MACSSARIPQWLKDWLPLPAIILAYHLGGLALRAMMRPRADALLARWDLLLCGVNPGLWLAGHLPAAALDLFELFYFSYFFFVPAAPGVMLARNGRQALWRLWFGVGLSYFICDLLFPWFPSTPPRLLWDAFRRASVPQAMNLFILDRYSVGANVFPSSHVAATLTMALVHARYGRSWFVAWALGIAVSTVSGGYHYGVDALGGIIVGLLAAWLEWKIRWPEKSPAPPPERRA